jgi:dihydropyrimidinase
MDALVRQGVTSFKLFMAYPGVFMLDDASIFKALMRTGRTVARSACTLSSGVIDVLTKKALAEARQRQYRATRPAPKPKRRIAPSRSPNR